MTVILDLVGVQNRDHGERGIARYILQLASALERNHPGLIDEYWIHGHLPVPGVLEPLISTGRIRVLDPDRPILKPSPSGIFIAGSVFENSESIQRIVPAWSRGPGWRSMAILYDLIPLQFPDIYLHNPILRTGYRTRADTLAGIDHLLPISEASAADATELLGIQRERMSVIWAGADDRFAPPTVRLDEVLGSIHAELPQIEPGYLMFPSGIEPRKNVDRMLEAYASLPAALRDSHQLVLVCRVTDQERVVLNRRAEALGITGRLVITGFVSDELLVQLYQAAHLVIFPALYEGFGLPVLEGMQCGAPVICSESSSLVEIQTDPTARFDPTDTDAMVMCMRRFLESESERQRLLDAPPPPHTWERAASITADAIERLKPQRQPSATETLAIVTPLPPQASGIADYAERLIRSLRAQFDITAFTDVPTQQITPIDGVTIYEIEQFESIEQISGAFDHVMYLIGNSSFHVKAFELLQRRPGIVQLHDVRLTGLFSEVYHQRPQLLPPGGVGELLAQHYPGRYRPALENAAVIWPETAQRFGCYLSRPVTQRADAVVVHSQFAASLLALDGCSDAEVLFDVPIERTSPVRQLEESSAPPQLASFGILAPTKQPERIIRAFAQISPLEATLHFVGWGDPSYIEQLGELASQFGVAEQITFHGHVEGETYRRMLDTTTVAIQLRTSSNGESSGTVADTLAHGIPTIVSDIGAQTELPSSIVCHVSGSDDPNDVAAALTSLLGDPNGRQRYRDAIMRYAETHTYDDAAKRLADFLKCHRQRSQRNVAPWRNAAPCY